MWNVHQLFGGGNHMCTFTLLLFFLLSLYGSALDLKKAHFNDLALLCFQKAKWEKERCEKEKAREEAIKERQRFVSHYSHNSYKSEDNINFQTVQKSA